MSSISVVIPVYNRHDTIRNAIKSIYAQNWNKNKLEIILSDDNSEKPFDYLLEKFPDLKIIRSTKNSGAGVARQRGMNIATGKWITFLDADDEFTNHFFEILNKVDIRYNIIRTQILIKFIEGGEQLFNGDTLGLIHGSIYRMGFLKKYNITFDDKLRISEDTLFQVVASKFAEKSIYYSDICGYIFYKNKYSTTYSLGEKWHTSYQTSYFHTKFLIKCDGLLTKNEKENYLLSNMCHIFEGRQKCDVIDPNAINIYFDYIQKYLNLNKWESIELLINKNATLLSHINTIESLYHRYKTKKDYILSIIIPVYNSHQYISKNLDHLYKVLGGYIKYTEIIITDDCSDNSDYSYLLPNHKNLKIINNDTNVKMGLNRNRGLDIADGSWVCFIDGDDEGLSSEAFHEFFSLANKNVLYNVIWGKCDIEKDFVVSVLSVLHGKFYKKSFLDSQGIRFSDKIINSEDYYFNQRVIFSISEKRKNSKSIFYSDSTYYLWNYNEDSVFRRKYNDRECLEEFLDEHIYSSILAVQDGYFSDEMWKIVLLHVVISTCNYISLYKNTSKNFKKDNIMYLCGIMLILKNRYNITLSNFDDYFNEYIERVECLYSKDLNGEAYRNFDRTLLKISYNIILRMSTRQIEKLTNEFKKVGIDIMKTKNHQQ